MTTNKKADHARKIGMKPGETRNPAGAKNKVRVRKSKLRALVESLREAEPKAIEVIKASVNGEEVDKTQLDSCRWLITSINTIEKSALQEELALTKLKIDLLEVNNEGIQSPSEIKQETQSRLSLVYTAPDDDD